MSGRPRPPVFVDIPMGTPVKACRGARCGAAVYWVRTLGGRRMPIDVSSVAGCVVPTESASGRGVAHWGHCPDRDQFSRQRGT